MTLVGVWRDDSQIDELLVVRRPSARVTGTKTAGAVCLQVVSSGPVLCGDLGVARFPAPAEPSDALLRAIEAFTPVVTVKKKRRLRSA